MRVLQNYKIPTIGSSATLSFADIKKECGRCGRTPFCYHWIVGLFHFLEVYVGHMVVGAAVVAAGSGVGACVGVETCTGVSAALCLSLGVEDILLGCLELCFDVLDCSVDTGDILSLVSFLELGDSIFDSGLLVGGNLVAEVGKLFLGLEDDCIGLVEFVDTLFLLGVACGVGCGFVLHTFDFSVSQTR